MLSRFLILISAFLAFTSFSSATMADSDPIYTGTFSNVAVGGYDAVAYFSDGKPVEGSSEFTTEYLGAEFHFSSAENKAKFDENPETYAPQYGGYCAWAIAQGKTVKGDPERWHIEDNKLYLNYNESVQETWLQDVPGFIAKADANWPAVLK